MLPRLRSSKAPLIMTLSSSNPCHIHCATSPAITQTTFMTCQLRRPLLLPPLHLPPASHVMIPFSLTSLLPDDITTRPTTSYRYISCMSRSSHLATLLSVESYHSPQLSHKYVNTSHPTELSTVNPDHHHSTPAATTPMPQLTSPPSTRSLIVTLHHSPDYLPPSPSTIPVVSFSPSLSPLPRNMPPIHSPSSVTWSSPVSQSNQLSPGQEVPLSGVSGALGNGWVGG